MAFDGTPIGDISTNIYALGLAVVEDEVWFGGENSYSIGRVTLNGTPLPSFNVGNYAEGIAVVPEPATLFLFGLGALVVRTYRE
jgi:hypothetical protein